MKMVELLRRKEYTKPCETSREVIPNHVKQHNRDGIGDLVAKLEQSLTVGV
jgi:hypothetical protein